MLSLSKAAINILDDDFCGAEFGGPRLTNDAAVFPNDDDLAETKAMKAAKKKTLLGLYENHDDKFINDRCVKRRQKIHGWTSLPDKKKSSSVKTDPWSDM